MENEEMSRNQAQAAGQKRSSSTCEATIATGAATNKIDFSWTYGRLKGQKKNKCYQLTIPFNSLGRRKERKPVLYLPGRESSSSCDRASPAGGGTMADWQAVCKRRTPTPSASGRETLPSPVAHHRLSCDNVNVRKANHLHSQVERAPEVCHLVLEDSSGDREDPVDYLARPAQVCQEGRPSCSERGEHHSTQ